MKNTEAIGELIRTLALIFVLLGSIYGAVQTIMNGTWTEFALCGLVVTQIYSNKH